MPLSTSVKFYKSGITGAPTVYADAGGLVGALDAILVNGYASNTVTSIMVASGVATVNCTGHPFYKYAVVTISGNGGVNGDFRITAITTNSFTIETTGIADGTYGSGSAKIAALGFEIYQTATNKRIYRSTDATNRNLVYLYVDDTNTASGWNDGSNKSLAYVAMVCDVVDISTFTTLSSSWAIKAPATSGTTAYPWTLIGDNLGFYMRTLPASTSYFTGFISPFTFMQINSLITSDPYATLLEGYISNSDPVSGSVGSNVPCRAMMGPSLSFNIPGKLTRTIARDINYTGLAVAAAYVGVGIPWCNSSYYGVSSGGVTQGANNGYGSYASSPNTPNLGYIVNAGIQVAHSNICRGTLPGMYSTWQNQPFSDLTIVEGAAGLGSKKLMFIHESLYGANYATNTLYVGGYYYDLIGPWR